MTSTRLTPPVRLVLRDLPPRTDQAKTAVGRVLERLGAAEGAACRQTCDCRAGLVCLEAICVGHE
jgi:hypothetical protein